MSSVRSGGALCLALTLALTLALAGCGNLPRPFGNNDHPRRLAQPPPARLAVATPFAALLPDSASAAFSNSVVDALVNREVPAVAGPAREGDWRLVLSAELHGDKVVPAYTVENPKGEAKGTAQGHAVNAASWSAAGDDTMKQVASADAGTIADLLTGIEAARQRSDPSSLVNRPPKVFVKGVGGAPGDGDAALARNMRQQVQQLGDLLVDSDADADFVVSAEVFAKPGPPDNTTIEIEWSVTDRRGRLIGKLSQLHDVPTAVVEGFWGDVAVAAATEAAGGLQEVVQRQIPARTPPDTAKPAA